MIILVILIAAVLRFWQLTTVPPALDWDEVSNAYNGYSILKTGRDEFGQSFPILFRAYDGYVPPVLIYLNSLSIAIFGLNEFAARLPNALLGVLTVWGVYLLAKELFKNSQSKFEILNLKFEIPALAALMLAITPWHVLYSRVNTFALTPVFFIVFGTYYFLKSFEGQKYLILAEIFLILAIFSYFSAYIFVPLFVSALAFIYREKFKLKLLLALIPLILSSLLILFSLPGGQNRLRGISIFNDPDIIKIAAEEAKNEGVLGQLLHNRRFVYAQEILKGYFINWRGDFLFGNGDAVERMKVSGPGLGLLLLWFLPFLVRGVFYLIDQKPPGWKIWFAWLALAPIAAATSLPQPVSTRTTIMIPALVVITAYGFWVFARQLPTVILRVILIILLAFNVFLFLHQYFVHFPYEKSHEWFYGYRQLFNYLNNDENRDKKVHFIYGQPDQLDQVHMFLLFYNKIDPATWQVNGGTQLGCIGTTGQFSFDRFTFVPYSCLDKPFDYKVIADDDLIVTSRMINENYGLQINYLDGSGAFYLYEYKYATDDLEEFTTATN